jgi:hypothetical protein
LLYQFEDETRKIARTRVTSNGLPYSPTATLSWVPRLRALPPSHEFVRNNLIFQIKDGWHGASVAHPTAEQADNEKSLLR